MKCLANLLVLIVLVTSVLAAYGQQPQRVVENTPNTEADVKEIQAWVDRYCATVTAGDFDGYRAFWSEDVVWLPPNTPVRKGIEACMEHNRPLFQCYNSVETMSVEEIKLSGRLALARVNYTYQGTPKPGSGVEPLTEDGKGIFLLWHKPDGSWIATHCVWNSNLPSEKKGTTQ